MKISRLWRRLVFAFLDPVQQARKLGVKIGTHCRLLDNPALIFGSEPWLITIGNHVEITYGVRLVTHDGAVWVLRSQKEFSNMDVFGPISIADNCFIGAGAIILPGCKIGKNCIVGAGSVVTHDVPDNSVIAGSPAKIICSLGTYQQKNSKKMLSSHAMNMKQKKVFLQQQHPEWFT